MQIRATWKQQNNPPFLFTVSVVRPHLTSNIDTWVYFIELCSNNFLVMFVCCFSSIIMAFLLVPLLSIVVFVKTKQITTSPQPHSLFHKTKEQYFLSFASFVVGYFCEQIYIWKQRWTDVLVIHKRERKKKTKRRTNQNASKVKLLFGCWLLVGFTVFLSVNKGKCARTT